MGCVLLTSSNSVLSEENGSAVKTWLPLSEFLIAAVYLLILALRWTYQLLRTWRTSVSILNLSLAGLPPPPASRPWGCMISTVLAVVALFGSIISLGGATASHVSTLLSLYMLAGFAELLSNFPHQPLLPESVYPLVLSTAQLSLPLLLSPSFLQSAGGLQELWLLSAPALVAAIASILKSTRPKKEISVDMCKVFATAVQASWLCHLSIKPFIQEEPQKPLSVLVFCVHLLGWELLYLLLLPLFSPRQTQGSRASSVGSRQSLISPTHSPKTGFVGACNDIIYKRPGELKFV